MYFDILPDIKSFIKKISGEIEIKSSIKKYVCVFIFLLVLQGRKWTYSQIGLGVLKHRRHKSNVCRFFRSSALDTMSILRVSQDMLLSEADMDVSEKKGVRIWVLDIDSTYRSSQSRRGENLIIRHKKGKKKKKKRGRQNRKRMKRSVHIWVKGLLITDRGGRIPLASKPYYTKEYCKKKHLKFRTQPEIAGNMIREARVPDDVVVVVIGDSFFEGSPVHKAIAERGFYWILPSDENRNLSRVKNSDGKTPKKVVTFGKELQDSAFEIVTFGENYEPFKEYSRSPYKRRRKQKRTYYVCKRKLSVSKLGEVYIVFSKKVKLDKETGETTYTFKTLMTNLSWLTAKEIVALYELRWEIELFFKELKSCLGWDEYRFQKFSNAEHFTNLILITFIFLELFRLKKLKQSKGKELQTIKDARTPKLIELIKKETIKSEFNFIKKRLNSKHGRKTLDRLLNEALST